MLKIIKKQLPVELTEEGAVSVRESLQASYNSLLYKVRLEYLNRLGLEPGACNFNETMKTSSLTLGELYLLGDGTISYIKAKRGEGMIQAGVITNGDAHEAEGFFNKVRDIISGISNNVFDWQISEDQIPLEVEDAKVEMEPVTPEQITAAKALVDRESRQLFEQIKRAGSIFLNKIECSDRAVMEERIHHFTDLGLLNTDYAVLCHRTGQQILRVSDKATIDESSQKAFKCFICGSPIADESIEEVLACTESGSAMLSDRAWLVILVRGIFEEMGIPCNSMNIYRSADLPVQIFLSINGLRYLFVLCTEAMTLDQAYLVGAHLKAYKLDSAVIISTEKITTLMRSHLEQISGDTKFNFLDNIDNISADLQKIIHDQQREYLRQQLQDLVCLTKVDVASMVLKRVLPVAEKESVLPSAVVDTVAHVVDTVAQIEPPVTEVIEEVGLDEEETKHGKKNKKK
ncbi:hypothetical protein IJT10_09250 [bacterium]|nr:hypothetical protein [bacterium]